MSVNQVFSSPVVLIFFNRPEQTQKVFDRIKEAKPKKLFLISDGPRLRRAGEGDEVAACRELVAQIDWECDVLRNYSDQNLGCRQRVISGLDWVFSQVDSAIILEDDCVPNADFFLFTDELLKRYEKDESVGAICGTNALEKLTVTNDSYFFSRMPAIWGWATWARVWGEYDGAVRDWPLKKREGLLAKVLGNKNAVRYWTESLDGVYRNRIDTWDYQFTYLLWRTNQLAIIPARNLISNIGFGANATHTHDPTSALSNLKSADLEFPLMHPSAIQAFVDYDNEITSSLVPAAFRLHLGRLMKRIPRPIASFVTRIYSKLISSAR